MKAVFSTRFKADLKEAEARYREISERLASELRERVAGQAREIIRWSGGDHAGPHGFPAVGPSHFRFTSTTKCATARFGFSVLSTNGVTPIS